MAKKTFILDLDGTMYRGPQIIESAKVFYDRALENGFNVIFLTNNSMRTQEENARHMLTMGYENIKPEQFFNSAMAAAKYAAKLNEGNKAFYIGANGMKEALLQNGFEITEENPDFVFVGLDKKADYAKYSKAVPFLLSGATLIGTNPDRILAKPGGFEVGNGSIVAMFEYCANTKSAPIGKPSPVILDMCLEHFQLNKNEIILVGDNLETDIALGYNSNVDSIFVQTGVHTEKDLEGSDRRPKWVVKDLAQIDLSEFS